jgi:GNAT superfamily N-acetyltransferase
MSKDARVSFHLFEKVEDMPEDAREMFAEEIKLSAGNLDHPDAGAGVLFVAAVTDGGKLAGGVYLDIASVGTGPIEKEKKAILERIAVRPSFQRQGLGTRLMDKACEAAKRVGCLHIQTCANWDCPAELRLLRKCGFALVDLNEPGEGESYFAVKPL